MPKMCRKLKSVIETAAICFAISCVPGAKAKPETEFNGVNWNWLDTQMDVMDEEHPWKMAQAYMRLGQRDLIYSMSPLRVVMSTDGKVLMP